MRHKFHCIETKEQNETIGNEFNVDWTLTRTKKKKIDFNSVISNERDCFCARPFPQPNRANAEYYRTIPDSIP